MDTLRLGSFLFAISLLLVTGCGKQQPSMPAMPPAEVGVVTVTSQTLPVTQSYQVV